MFLCCLDTMSKAFEGFKFTLRAIASWAKTSGFPDTWPLQTSFYETNQMMQKAYLYDLWPYLAIGARYIPESRITNALVGNFSYYTFHILKSNGM